MRRSYLIILISVAPVIAGCGGCAPTPNFWADAKPGQKKILVTFPPLFAMTHAIAGEDAYVLSMLSTVGPHDYDFSAVDLLKVRKADLLISNGLTLDDAFVDKMLRSHKDPALVKLNLGKTILADPKLKGVLKKGGHVHVMPNGQVHRHGDYDPHIWLGPKQAMAMTRLVADKLAEIDPPHAKNYQKRADEFIDKLKELEAYGKDKLKGKHVHIVTQHESLVYFADAFGLEIVGSIQAMPGMDPDAASLAKLVKLCKEKQASLIAVEPQYSPAQAELLQGTLKRAGVDAKIVTIDPLETAEIADGSRNPDPAYYLKMMRKNIDTIVEALP